MDGKVGSFCRQDAVLLPDGCRDDFLGWVADRQSLLHRFHHRCIGKTGCQGINGQYPAGIDGGRVQAFKAGGGHIVADEIPGDGAVEDVFLAVLQLLGGKFPVEEGEGQPPGAVSHLDLGNVQAFADVGGAWGVHHHSLEAGGLVHLQLFNGYKPGAILVAPGEMANKVFQCEDV